MICQKCFADKGPRGPMRQSIAQLTHEPEVPGSIPHTFVPSSAESRRAVVSYWQMYVHEVLVNLSGGLSLPRKSVVKLNDRRHKTTTQQQQQIKGWTLQTYHVTGLSSPASWNVGTNERGLKPIEFATFNNLVLTNTLGPHKPTRRWTWQSLDRKHHNQIDNILVRKCFRSGVNIHRIWSFPGADIRSDHDLVVVMMTF